MFSSATAAVGAVEATAGSDPRSAKHTPPAAHCREQAAGTLATAHILPHLASAGAPVGSSWDAEPSGPDELKPEHLAEWLGSAVAPELVAANVDSLAGRSVLELLTGERLDHTGAHGKQYATAEVLRLLRPLEPIAAAGGWWVSGLDPLADWAPMAWGQFKSDAPRYSTERSRSIKYEAPIGQRTRSAFLRVPAAVALLVAQRWELPLPAAVLADHNGAAGAFWRWVSAEPSLPLVITEGAKKAGALLSAGVPAVALPGIWNGAPRDAATDRPALLPDLAAVPWAKRRALVLFDWSDSEKGRRDVSRAARRLGHHLRRAGAVVLVGICPGPAKGADDHLAAGGTWEQLAAALAPLTAEPALPRLRRADETAPAGYLADGVNLGELSNHRLLAIAAPMGAGKTQLARGLMAPYLADGVPILAPTHRVSLGEASAAAVGLPWAATPNDDQRLQGLGLCWDSLRPSSGLRINAAEWSGSVLLLDEVAQGIEHLLFGTGTAVAQHRPETLATIAALLRTCTAAVAMDAQLSEPVLHLLEALTGSSAHLLRSAHQPMAGRAVLVPAGLTPKKAAEQGRAHLLRLLRTGSRVLVVTTAQQASRKGAAQNLARMAKRHPLLKESVLLIDSENPDNAAAMAADPNGTAAAYKCVIASPSITSGLSIDGLGLFDEVLILAPGGQLTCEHIAQAAARVRDPRCPVTIYAPETAPRLRIGSGDTSPAALLKHLAATEAHLLAGLVGAAEWDASATNESPWLRCWLEMAAHRNRQSYAYSATIAALLEREGWAVTTEAETELQVDVIYASDYLKQHAEAAQFVEDALVINAEPLTASEAEALAKKRRRTKEERAQLHRHRVAERWGLGAADPTPELLEADRDGLSQRLRFAWMLQDDDYRQLAAAHDRRRAAQLTATGTAWAPDLTRELLGHKLDAATALGLPNWLRRREWFSADDAQLEDLHKTATKNAGSMRANLGASPGKRASGTLRALLKMCGFVLQSKRQRCGNGSRGWVYRIVPVPLPAGVSWAQLANAWTEQLSGGV